MHLNLSSFRESAVLVFIVGSYRSVWIAAHPMIQILRLLGTNKAAQPDLRFKNTLAQEKLVGSEEASLSQSYGIL
jgi:hypothetical protein